MASIVATVSRSHSPGARKPGRLAISGASLGSCARWLPIVAMSGYAFANAERAPDFLRMTIELGAACCLRKPFTPDALLTSVNQCITTPEAPERHPKL